MKKNLLIALSIVFLLPQAGFVSSSNRLHHSYRQTAEDFPTLIRNPGLMSMHRREFIAAGIAQGMAAAGEAKDHNPEINLPIEQKYHQE